MSEIAPSLFAEGLLTIGEVCRWLRCSRSFLYGLMASGALPYVALTDTPGRSVRRIPRRALTEFATGRLTTTGKERSSA